MRDRMLPTYVKVLKAPLRSSLRWKDLSKAVIDLALSYHLNYKLGLPDISYMVMLVHYAKVLSLPSKPALLRSLPSFR